MNSKDTSYEIKHLEHLQRKNLSKTARRNVVSELVNTIDRHNRLVSAENKAEDRRQMFDRNLETAKDAFRHERGRKFI